MVLASYPVTATGASFAGRSFSSSREAIETTLRLVASQLGARTAYVARITRGEDRFEVLAVHEEPGGLGIPEGLIAPLGEAWCRSVAESGQPCLVADARAGASPLAGALQRRFDAGSYVGAPILRGDGSLFGTLAALDPEPRRRDGRDVDLLAVLARSLAASVERDHLMDGRRQVQRRILSKFTPASRGRRVAPIVEDVPSVLEAISEGLGWEAGSLWQSLGWEWGALWGVDRRASLLRCVETWHAPRLDAGELDALSQTSTFGPGVGLPGLAWATGQPAWLGDLAVDARTRRGPAAARAGLHGAFALPIKSGDEVLAVVEFLGPAAREPDGELLNVMSAVGTQISQLIERRRAEDAARESELRRGAILEAALDCIVVADHEGRVTEFNPAAERTFGLHRASALGRALVEVIFPPVVREAHRRSLATYLKTGRGLLNRRVETRAMRADGTEFPAEIAITPLQLQEALIFTLYLRDITDRKRAEGQLRATLAELDVQFRKAERARGETLAVLDAASEVMILISPDRRLLNVNQRFADLLGLAREEVLGQRLDEHRDRLEQVLADPVAFELLVARSVADTHRRFVETIVQRSPERRELELTSSPVHTADGEHLGRLFVLRDVTRQREVARMKDEFVSLVSHELRTPLTSIKGYVDLLIDGELGELGEEQRAFLAVVKKNADRLVGLINDLLDISRIESGKLALEREPLELRPLVEGVALGLRPQVEGKQQQLTIGLPLDLPPVLGDPDRVVQILTNLLSNAHKYTPADGQIAISARPEGTQVRVSVRDTGCGLTPEEQSQLFNRFFRARNHATQEVGGTGLGLAITRSLVEMHGGQIGVVSAPGEGSTFSFTLPAVEGAG
ncbi:MAG TPA: PAS domain S-box protein [Chloroflexota bacterium]